MERTTGEEKVSAIEARLDPDKSDLLAMGAAGRLLITCELEEVLLLEDPVAWEFLKQMDFSTSRLHPDMFEARHEGHVKAVIAEGPFGLIVLGAAHDLSDNVRRLGNCEYKRVLAKRHREVFEFLYRCSPLER
jgi:hypothetical protein